jgi:CheY-like chemotaxis protein
MSKKLLVIDDSMTIRKVIELVFDNNSEIELTTVNNGTDAVLEAKELKPDLILCDLGLSDKNGYEVSKEIKSDSELKDIPVVIMISQHKELDEALFADSSANDHIAKPFGSDEIINKVNSFIGEEEVPTEEAAEEVAALEEEVPAEEVAFTAVEPSSIEEEAQKADEAQWSVSPVDEIKEAEAEEIGEEEIHEAEILEAEEIGEEEIHKF